MVPSKPAGPAVLVMFFVVLNQEKSSGSCSPGVTSGAAAPTCESRFEVTEHTAQAGLAIFYLEVFPTDTRSVVARVHHPEMP